MNLHEYQSKALFSQYGISVPENRVINKQSQVKTKLDELGGPRWVVKAQVHAGGRGATRRGGLRDCLFGLVSDDALLRHHSNGEYHLAASVSSADVFHVSGRGAVVLGAERAVP